MFIIYGNTWGQTVGRKFDVNGRWYKLEACICGNKPDQVPDVESQLYIPLHV